MLNLYGKTFASRLLDRQRAISVARDHAGGDPRSGAEIVTVSLRREAAGGKTGECVLVADPRA